MTLALCAATAGALTVWLVVPDPSPARLLPATPRSLPSWAKARPGAMDSQVRWLIAIGVGLLVWLYWWSVTAWVTVAIPGLIVGLWIGLGRLESQAARQNRIVAASFVPETLDIMALCLRAGQPLRPAIATAISVLPPAAGRPLRDVERGINVGMPDSQAWSALSADEAWGPVAQDIAMATAHGLPVQRVLIRHSESMRRAVKAERLASAKSVGVKSVLPLGLCHLPAFIFLGVIPVIAGGVAHIFG